MTEYPTEEALLKIKEWDILKWDSLLELLEFIKDEWSYPDYFVLTGKNVLRLELHTGGWSGNEDIIEALMNNSLFWILYWVKSKRGGHYYFKFKKPK